MTQTGNDTANNGNARVSICIFLTAVVCFYGGKRVEMNTLENMLEILESYTRDGYCISIDSRKRGLLANNFCRLECRVLLYFAQERKLVYRKRYHTKANVHAIA